MNPFRILIRQPIRTFVSILLLCVGCLFFCLSFNVLAASQKISDEIDSSFTTIALPTNQTREVTVEVDEGLSFTVNQSVITSEMWDYFNNLPENCKSVKGIYRQKYISAWSPGLMSTTTVDVDRYNDYTMNVPYNTAVFVVEITDIFVSDEIVEGEFYPAELKTKLLETVSLHPSYTAHDKINIYCVFKSEDEMEKANLAVGNKYIVYGDYTDKDYMLRSNISSIIGCSPKDIDWDNLVYGDNGVKYENEGHSVGLTDTDLESVETGFLMVQNIGAGWLEGYYPYQIDGTESSVSARELFDNPTIELLAADLSSFLSSEAGEIWRNAINENEIRHESFPVIGTDLLESLYHFMVKDMFVSEGRSFSEKEYLGEKVCIIPETVAVKSGISVGDKINLSFYWGADPYSNLSESSNISAQSFSNKVGFSSEGNAYTVVGIYRHLNAWEESSYSFNPNTIFVPNASLDELCYTGSGGVFYSIVIKNGGIDEVKTAVASQGFPEDILLYFDEGYSDISPALESLESSAFLQFAVSCTVWLSSLFIYLFLFVNRQKQSVSLMLSLGMTKGNAVHFWMAESLIPFLCALITGFIGSLVVTDTIVSKTFTSAFEGFSFSAGNINTDITMLANMASVPFWALLGQIIVQLLVSLIILYIFICRYVKKQP